MDDTNYYENMIAELRAERDALAALLKEIREQGYRKEMTARIDAALTGDKP